MAAAALYTGSDSPGTSPLFSVTVAWSWGAGTDGQLGSGSFEDSHAPRSFLLPPAISTLSLGGAHAIALTAGGVLTWGRGTHGQLGHGDLLNLSEPKFVKFFDRYKVTFVSAGWNHSGFVTDNGQLFMCGDSSFGQLGDISATQCHSPTEVPFFTEKHAELIACGMRHSLVLVRGNLVYGFGSGRRGQLGRQLSRVQKSSGGSPEIIEGLGDGKVVSLYANGDHSAALTNEGQLFIWGRGFCGSSDNHQPMLVAPSLKISQVALGWHHALILSDEVYMFGAYRHTKLSSHPLEPIQQEAPTSSSTSAASLLSLEKIPCPDGERVVQIAAGSEHSAVLTDKGTIVTWGWGEHGQLGHGDTCDRASPTRVDIPSRKTSGVASVGLYCGSGFTVATSFV